MLVSHCTKYIPLVSETQGSAWVHRWGVKLSPHKILINMWVQETICASVELDLDG